MTNKCQFTKTSGNIKATYYRDIGGLVGYASTGKIDNCVSEVNIEQTSETWGIGGILGVSFGTVIISNSHNKGNLTGAGVSGGIVGAAENGNLVIVNCYNEGMIANSVATSGGLLGSGSGDNQGNEIILLNSYNKGTISSSATNMGGLIAYIDIVKTIIFNSYNLGSLEKTNASGIVSGLVNIGANATPLIMNNVYNAGTISAPSGYPTFGVGSFNTSSSLDIKNVYYNNGNSSGNVVVGEKKTEDEIKNLLSTLNNNCTLIPPLESISSLLKGYQLSSWIQDSNGYPTLDISK